MTREELLPPDVLKRIPAFYSNEETPTAEVIVRVKYFLAGFTWLVTECEKQEDGDVMFYGFVINHVDPSCSEWGYFTLNQLMEIKLYGVLEVRLTKKAAITACTDELNTAEQIRDLAEGSESIFMETLGYIIPRGNYYKKQKAEQLIRERVPDWKLRSKMLRLLTLIPEKKSIHLAIKALNYRKFKDVLTAFAEIDVSPVTIRKRHSVKNLKSLYSYLG